MKSFILLFISLFTTVALSEVLTCAPNLVQLLEATPSANIKSGNNGLVRRVNGQATSTLCSITYPASARGKKCRLRFEFPSIATGSRKGQIYTLGSASFQSSTFNGRGAAYRDQHRGTFYDAKVGGKASWDTGPGNTFDCSLDAPVGGGKKGYEIAPQWDNDWITWSLPNGLKIEVLP